MSIKPNQEQDVQQTSSPLLPPIPTLQALPLPEQWCLTAASVFRQQGARLQQLLPSFA